jgi:hypothetical protein
MVLPNLLGRAKNQFSYSCDEKRVWINLVLSIYNRFFSLILLKLLIPDGKYICLVVIIKPNKNKYEENIK